MAKYGNFWKSTHVLESTGRRAKITSISTPWIRKRVYVQLLELLPIAEFYGQIWKSFLNSARILETAARRAKQAQFRPLGEKETTCTCICVTAGTFARGQFLWPRTVESGN